jgi:predicted glycosyltransferase involved in capsule biosynthesis
MKITVVIPWCNRSELGYALPENIAALQNVEAEVLIVNSGGDIHRLRSLTSGYLGPHVRVIHMAGAACFNKAECLNLGVFQSCAEWIFTLDCDVVPDANFFPSALGVLEPGNRFVTVKEVIESEPGIGVHSWSLQGELLQRVTTTKIVHQNGRSAIIQHCIDKDGTRNGTGLVLVRREQFIAIEGLNSGLKGWGYEDVDFQVRLQLGLGLKRISMGRARHMSHPSIAGAETTQARNIAVAWKNYSEGKLNGTFTQDVERWKDRLLTCSN